MKKVLNKNNFIFILILMTLFNLIMPTISYAANVSINDVLKETVAGWYMILRGLGIGAMILLLLILAGKAAISRNSADSALIKRMLLDWLVGLLLIIFIHYFMVFAINVNEDMVKGSEKLGQSLSGMKEGQEISLYESVISKAYEIKFKPGTIGMILYIMLVYYAYKFALVYLKRYVNVLVLILIAPIVCLMYAFKKVLSGKAITLKKWFKEFIYNVFLQSLHAVMYGTLVGLTLKYSNDGESFLGAILCMILFGVIFKVDKLVRKFFNSVGGDTSVAVSKIDSAFSNTKKAVGTFASGNAQAGATALMYGSKSDEFQNMKSKFGENLNWNKVADTFKGDSKNAWLDMKGGVSDVFGGTKDGLAETFEDMKGTINGDHKYVSEEAIAKEQERLDNAGFFGKTWRAMVALPGNIKEKLPKKIEELRLHLENKKQETIQNIQDLRRDVETIRSIPKMIKGMRKVPPAIQAPNVEIGEIVYDEKYDALIDFDIDQHEIEERITAFIAMSSGEISSAIILAMGYESVIRCPKLGMMMLAEDNYRNMIHPEIPMERRKVIAGVKHESRPALTFKNFENGSIDTIQKVVMSDVMRNFAGVSTMQRLATGVLEQRITFRTVPEGSEKFTVTYSGKKNAARNMYEKRELVFERMHAFRNDINIAKNINIINNLEALRKQGKLSNLSPEMLEMLKNAGVIIEVKENGKFEGGYIVLDNAIDNAVMRTRVGHYVTENAGTETANKINKFLNANADSELAIRISNYIIDNPESTLATVIDRVQITEDGRIVTKVDSFQMSGNQPNLSQLGMVTDQGIVQKILTPDGQEVEQIIDLQGRIIKEATDANGNIVEFPVEQGRRLQTVMTPEGTMILQVVSQDGSSIMPLVLNENAEAKTEVVNIDTIETTDGIYTEVTPPVGEIQLVNRLTGEVESIKPENVTLQLVRNEDGELQIIKVETQEVFEVNEDTIFQVFKPEEGIVQILDQESNTIETAYGEVAVQVLKDKGIMLTPEEEAEFIAREELKAKLTALSDATAINLATGENESIIQLGFETEVLTALVAETVEKPAEVTTVEEHLDKMNNLFEQIGILQNQELTESLLGELEVEKELVMVEIGEEKAKVFEQLAATGEISSSDIKLDDLVSSISIENVVNQVNDSDDESDAFSDIYSILTESDATSTSTTVIDTTVVETSDTTETTSSFDSLYSMIADTPADKKVDVAVSAITAGESVVEDTSSASDSFSKLYSQLTESKEVRRTSGVKQTKKQTTTSENEKVNLVVEVKGAVINPCKIEEVVLKVTTVDDIVRKYCGGLSENINRDKYKDMAKKQARIYNGKILQIPEMTKEEIANKKKKQKENKAEHKITIYLSGNGSEVYGEKVIEENSKLYDIRTLFSRNANREAISVNNKIVSLSYILKDGDEVYIPLMTSDEKDTRRGINAGFIETVIKNFFENYIHKNRFRPEYSGKTELEILQIIIGDPRLLKNNNKSILNELKTKHNIEIPTEELEERIKKYIETEIAKLEKDMPRKATSKKGKNTSSDSEIVQVTAIDPNLIRQLNFVGNRRVTVRRQADLFESSSRNRMDLTGNDDKDKRIAEIEGYFRTRRDRLIASK